MNSARARFYFDLQSPLAYLAAERALTLLPGRCEWVPVQSSALLEDPLAAPDVYAQAGHSTSERAEIAARAQELGLLALRWPEPFPFDSALAMRAATYASSIGRGVAFAQAAFRQAFAAGRSLAEPDNVLIAAAACEMHPAAVLRGAQLRSVADALRTATEEAARIPIRELPALAVGKLVFHGPDAVERAAQALEGMHDRAAAARP